MYKKYIVLLVVLLFSHSAYSEQCLDAQPIHLDDIHYIVSSEAESVNFFQKHFAAREMAHPGERFNLARFLSIKWHDPTLTITPKGPYKDLPPQRNERWLKSAVIDSQTSAYFGAKWLAIAVPSLERARKNLLKLGVSIIEENTRLPLEPNAKTFKFLGPDGTEIVIVERKDKDFGDSLYSIDHLQFLVSNASESSEFFQKVFSGTVVKASTNKQLAKAKVSSQHAADKSYSGNSIALQVADAIIVVSEPEDLGLITDKVKPMGSGGTIRLGIDHLGFLYKDIQCASSQAIENGYKPLFPPTRYKYKNKPTVYTFTVFKSPDGFNIEMVQADGRIGPHSYYDQ